MPAVDTFQGLAINGSCTERKRPPHRNFLGLRFCQLSRPEVVRLITLRHPAPYRYVVTPNAHHVVTIQQSPQLLPIYLGAWLSLCDSQVLRRLAAIERIRLPLLTGSDLVEAIFEELNISLATPQRILIVGPDRSMRDILQTRYRHISFEVLPAPMGLGLSAEARLEVAKACVAHPWDILLLCVGCPSQEMIAQTIGELGRSSGVALCVGAAVDFVTGTRRRAPAWVRRLGIECAFRLLHEPARLWRRYLIESPKIFQIYLASRSQH